MAVPSSSADWQSQHEDLRERTMFSLENGSPPYDITFLVGPEKKRIAAHRLVLGLGSTVLYKTFFESPKKPDEELEAPTVSPESFLIMVKSFYDERTLDIKMENVMDVLRCADFYQAGKLETKCIQLIQTDIKPINACDIYEEAVTLDKPYLVNFTLGYIAHKFTEIVEVGGCKGISKETFDAILDFDGLDCEEIDVYEFMLTWASFESGIFKPSLDDLRRVLGQSLYKLRIRLMRGQEIADGPAQTLLTMEEGYAALMYVCGLYTPYNLPFEKAKRTSMDISDRLLTLQIRNRRTKKKILTEYLSVEIRGDLAPIAAGCFQLAWRKAAKGHEFQAELNVLRNFCFAEVYHGDKLDVEEELHANLDDPRLTREKSKIVPGKGVVAMAVVEREGLNGKKTIHFTLEVGIDNKSTFSREAVPFGFVRTGLQKAFDLIKRKQDHPQCQLEFLLGFY